MHKSHHKCTGESNADFIVITKGLTKTDKVALADPFAKDEKKASTTENEKKDEN